MIASELLNCKGFSGIDEDFSDSLVMSDDFED